MPSTPTASLRIEQQATGENQSVWGTKENTNNALLEQAIVGETTIALAGDTHVLTATNYTEDEARSAVLKITGTGGTVTIPNVKKAYYVRNTSTGDVIMSAGGVSLAVASSVAAIVYCDGTDVVRIADGNTRTPDEITAEITAILTDIQTGVLTPEQAAALVTLNAILIDPSPAQGDVLVQGATTPEWQDRDEFENTLANRWRFR